MKFLWNKLYHSLDQARNGRSWREIAREGGFSSSLFTRLSQGKPISVENLLKIVFTMSPSFMKQSWVDSFVKVKHS